MFEFNNVIIETEAPMSNLSKTKFYESVKSTMPLNNFQKLSNKLRSDHFDLDYFYPHKNTGSYFSANEYF